MHTMTTSLAVAIEEHILPSSTVTVTVPALLDTFATGDTPFSALTAKKYCIPGSKSEVKNKLQQVLVIAWILPVIVNIVTFT